MLNQTATGILVFVSVLFVLLLYSQSEDQSSDLQVSDNDKIQNEGYSMINFSGSSGTQAGSQQEALPISIPFSSMSSRFLPGRDLSSPTRAFL